MYAALCNVSWQPIGAEHEPECELVTGELSEYKKKHVRHLVVVDGKLEEKLPDLACTCQVSYSCSWRYAGKLVANVRQKNEDYMHFYCSGGEGTVAPEIRDALKEMGWEPIEKGVHLRTITFTPDTSGGDDDGQPYMGVAEVAQYMGVTRQAVGNWIRRGKFIEPMLRLKMGPIWKTEDVIAFREQKERDEG